MTAAHAIPLQAFSLACVLDAASLQLLLAEEGLTIALREEVDHIVAQWPVVTVNAAAGTSHRKAVAFRRNADEGWRGAVLVSFSPNGWDVVDSVPNFRDLLHVGLWLRAHAPTPTRSTSPVRMH